MSKFHTFQNSKEAKAIISSYFRGDMTTEEFYKKGNKLRQLHGLKPVSLPF